MHIWNVNSDIIDCMWFISDHTKIDKRKEENLIRADSMMVKSKRLKSLWNDKVNVCICGWYEKNGYSIIVCRKHPIQSNGHKIRIKYGWLSEIWGLSDEDIWTKLGEELNSKLKY